MKSLSHVLIAGLLMVLSPVTALSQKASGVEVWAQTCKNCHFMQPTARYTADQWKSIATHMKLTVRLTDAESEQVLLFLQGGAMRLVSAATVSDQGVEGNVTTPDTSNDSERMIFGRYCVPCHGAEGAGNGVAAASLQRRPADMTTAEFHQTRSDSVLVDVISHGKGAMPGFMNQLTAQQIRAIASYLRQLEK